MLFCIQIRLTAHTHVFSIPTQFMHVVFFSRCCSVLFYTCVLHRATLGREQISALLSAGAPVSVKLLEILTADLKKQVLRFDSWRFLHDTSHKSICAWRRLWFFLRLVSACFNQGFQLNSAWRRVNHPRWAAFPTKQEWWSCFCKIWKKAECVVQTSWLFQDLFLIDPFGNWKGLLNMSTDVYRQTGHLHILMNLSHVMSAAGLVWGIAAVWLSFTGVWPWHKLRQEHGVRGASGLPPRRYGTDTPYGLATIVDSVKCKAGCLWRHSTLIWKGQQKCADGIAKLWNVFCHAVIISFSRAGNWILTQPHA